MKGHPKIHKGEISFRPIVNGREKILEELEDEVAKVLNK